MFRPFSAIRQAYFFIICVSLVIGVSTSTSLAGPSPFLPETAKPAGGPNQDCHAFVHRRGPGNYSIYGNGPRTNDNRWINRLDFWIEDPNAANKFDPAKHIVGGRIFSLSSSADSSCAKSIPVIDSILIIQAAKRMKGVPLLGT